MSKSFPDDTTGLLIAWGDGDRKALDRLMSVVYQELRRLAHQQMRRERPGDTLQTTALVNEAYLKLVNYERVQARDRAHFLAIAAQAMRRVLIERARSRHSDKRGSNAQKVSLDAVADMSAGRGTDLLALDDALHALATIDPRKAQLVELKYFGGLTIEETAEVLGVSTPTVERDWRTARIWLHRENREIGNREVVNQRFTIADSRFPSSRFYDTRALATGRATFAGGSSMRAL